MDPEEIAALGGNQSAPSPTGLYDGATATNPRTGQRIVYRMSPTGRGRWVALSYETADPQSRERVENVQNMANIGARTRPQAQRFVERNFTTPTGGFQNDPEMPAWIRSIAGALAPETYTQADELRALSSQMVGSNWQPGTTGMFNTATEMEQARQRFPAPTNRGPANMDVYLNMSEDIAVQRAAAEAMRQWLGQRPNLDGFDQAWAQQEPEIRRRARAEAQAQMRRVQTNVNSPGQTLGGDIGRRLAARPAPSAPPQGAPQRRLRFDPATGDFE